MIIIIYISNIKKCIYIYIKFVSFKKMDILNINKLYLVKLSHFIL